MFDLLWQYCTISENSKAKAARDTSCFPRDKLLSKMDVFGRMTGAGVDVMRDILNHLHRRIETSTVTLLSLLLHTIFTWYISQSVKTIVS